MLEKVGENVYLIGDESTINELMVDLRKIDLEKDNYLEQRLAISKLINGKDVKVLFKGEYVQDYNKVVEDYENLKSSKRLDLMGDSFFIFLNITLNGYFSELDEIVKDYDNQYDLFYKYVLSKKNTIQKQKIEAIEFCKYAKIFGY